MSIVGNDVDPNASDRMRKVRQKDTKAELLVRKELFRRGLRYRVDYRVLRTPRRVADIAFTRLRIAVFIDGCFWHGCPLHATWPKRNAKFWREKIETNRKRDDDTNLRLIDDEWEVLRFWEHELPEKVADQIEKRVLAKRLSLTI